MATLAPIVGDVIVRLPDVLARVHVARSTLYRLIRAGDFPRPVKLSGPSGTAVGWRASDVDRWIASRTNPTEAARRG
jgi:prophage regulatory protein